MYEVATQFNEIASSESEELILGRAMLTEDDRKGVRNELNMATTSTTLLLTVSCLVCSSFILKVIVPLMVSQNQEIYTIFSIPSDKLPHISGPRIAMKNQSG
jgi:hypothetical protein